MAFRRNIGPVRRVLVAEPNIATAIDIECTLKRHGYHVVGPAIGVGDMVRTVIHAREPIDAALLEAVLSGEHVWERLHVLRNRGIPYAFVTNLHPRAVRLFDNQAPVVVKPYTAGEIVHTVAKLLKH